MRKCMKIGNGTISRELSKWAKLEGFQCVARGMAGKGGFRTMALTRPALLRGAWHIEDALNRCFVGGVSLKSGALERGETLRQIKRAVFTPLFFTEGGDVVAHRLGESEE